MKHRFDLMKCNLVLLAFVMTFVGVLASNSWEEVDNVLLTEIENHTFPGCTAVVGRKDGSILYAKGLGNFTYGAPLPYSKGNPAMSTTTSHFDMASCSKVVSATSAAMQFYQRGELDLDMEVSDKSLLGPDFAQSGKGDMTVRNLLLHNSGFYPDPFPYWYNSVQFDCPATKEAHPPEVFSCLSKIHDAVMKQTLQGPIGEKYVYSDLNFITLSMVIGGLAHDLGYVDIDDITEGCAKYYPGPSTRVCAYEAYVRKYLFSPLKMSNTVYLPSEEMWGQCAPTQNDTTYRHVQIQAHVHDQNTYAWGGISGHAGLFSTASDLSIFAHHLLSAGEKDPILNRTTIDYFTKEFNHSQSSRALGWNTNDPTVPDYGWDQSCKNFSPTTYMHLGYTGTMYFVQICIDPVKEVYAILLTNRVYPNDDHKTEIMEARKKFSAAVVDNISYLA